MSLSPQPAGPFEPLPPDALLEDGTPPSVELHPSITPGTKFKRYDARTVETFTIASCLAVAVALFALAQ
jgi:hypothetical protein